MKRNNIALLLILVMTIFVAACGKDITSKSDDAIAETSFDKETELKKIAIETTDSLSELVNCDTYIKALSSSEDIMKVIEGWKSLKIDKAEPIYVISLDIKEAERYLKSASNEDFSISEMPETLQEYMLSRVGDSISNIVNGRSGGASVLAASSVARFYKTFVPKGNVENQVWMIPCNDEVAVCVSFSNTGNGVLTVTAAYTVFNSQISDMILESGGFSVQKLQW